MRRLLLALLCAAAFGTQAQQVEDATGHDAGDAWAATDDWQAGGDQDAGEITDLHTIRVIERRPEYVDPFAFRNPDAFERTRFDRSWRETPSAQEIGMQGGIVNLAIGYAIDKTAEAVRRLPGWQNQIRPATARPPPLDQAQLDRAARLQEESGP